MSEPLPYANFNWLSADEINNINIQKLSDTNKEGYILEVDLEYPKNLHDLHNDFPLAPERMMIKTENLSPFCFNLLKDVTGKKAQKQKNTTLPKSEKLIPNLHDIKTDMYFTTETYNFTYSLE